jgi:hypothetical protein
MSSSQKAGGGEGLSPVQILALATLYYQESKQREKEEMLDRQRDTKLPP